MARAWLVRGGAGAGVDLDTALPCPTWRGVAWCGVVWRGVASRVVEWSGSGPRSPCTALRSLSRGVARRGAARSSTRCAAVEHRIDLVVRHGVAVWRGS